MSYDVEAVRRDFPILAIERRPGVPLVYLDNGASSQKPNAVIDAMSAYYRTTHANVHRGIHMLSENATEAYENARKIVQRFINAVSRREIVFTRGATESINLVAQSWGRTNLKPGDVVLSTVMEHHANIVPWQILAQERGFTLRYLSMLPDGTLDMAEYQSLLESLPVKLVAVTQCSNVLSTVNPVESMAWMAHSAGALILVDGAQSVPHMPVDVQQMDVDFLVFSGHKMLGPTGIGILYARRHLLDAMPPWMGGGDMISTVTLEGSTWNQPPYKFEAGTPSIAEAIGLGVAIDYLSGLGMANIEEYTARLAEYARERLHEIPQVKIYGEAPKRGSLVSFTIDGIHAHDAAQLLDLDGVAVRAGHHCAMPLHHRLGVTATARASFYVYNTYAEVDILHDSICRAIGKFSL